MNAAKAVSARFVALCSSLLAFIALGTQAQAMPNFAQAYGVQCNVCHTQVPALNSYGRYVQRTGYASLDPHVLKREYPMWFDVPVNYTQQTPTSAQWVTDGGVHADGGIGNGDTSDWTYHVQQWFVQSNQPGGLDTAWVAYNNLLNRSGHLFVGKVEVPAPSAYSQWFDLGAGVFAAPEITVGEHTYELDANRWGTKFVYDRNALDAEVAYVTDGNDLNGFNDYSDDTDKTLQYKIAFANPTKPLEVGYYGASGSWPLTEGGVDRYESNAFYVQRDPVRYVPGVLATYQMNYDASPGGGAPPTGSNGGSLEIYSPIGSRAMVSLGQMFTNDGMGDHTKTGNIDASFHVMRFVVLYAEEFFNQGQKPTWNGLVWFAEPIGPL